MATNAPNFQDKNGKSYYVAPPSSNAPNFQKSTGESVYVAPPKQPSTPSIITRKRSSGGSSGGGIPSGAEQNYTPLTPTPATIAPSPKSNVSQLPTAQAVNQGGLLNQAGVYRNQTDQAMRNLAPTNNQIIGAGINRGLSNAVGVIEVFTPRSILGIKGVDDFVANKTSAFALPSPDQSKKRTIKENLYAGFQAPYEYARTKPVETGLIFFAGGKLASAVSGAGKLSTATLIGAGFPVTARVGQVIGTAGTGALFAPTAISIYKDVKKEDYLSASGTFGKTIGTVALVGAGARIPAGQGSFTQYAGQETLIAQNQNIFSAQTKSFVQGASQDQIVKNLNTNYRSVEPSLGKYITGRTEYVYAKDPAGNIVRTLRPSLIPEGKFDINFKGGKATSREFKFPSGDPQPTIITQASNARMSNTFNSLVDANKGITKNPYGGNEKIDLMDNKAFNSLTQREQRFLRPQIKDKMEVFGGTSSGKPQTSDIDVFKSFGYATPQAKGLSKASGNEFTSSFNFLGRNAPSTVVSKGNTKILDVHPFSQKWAFPFAKESVKTGQGYTKTDIREEFSRRTFGSVTSDERFAKDVPEAIRIAQKVGAPKSNIQGIQSAFGSSGGTVKVTGFASSPSYPSVPARSGSYSGRGSSSYSSRPSAPSYPSTPSYPSSPSSPSRPSNPSKSPPSSPPSTPSYPSYPSTPSYPSYPSTPSYPSYPSTPSTVGGGIGVPLGFPSLAFPLAGFSRSQGGKQSKKYTPSLKASVLNIRASKAPSNAFTGLSTRPIISRMRRKRRK